MEKLQHATFNNVKFRFRKFDDLATIADSVGISPLLEPWLDLFAVEIFDSPDACLERLFVMVGMTGTVKMTSRYYVDPVGIAWPDDSLVVIADETDPHSVCVLISTDLRFS